MTTVGAEFIIEFSGISCSPEILGHSFKVARGDLKFRLDLPSEPDSFKFAYLGNVQVQGSTKDPRDYAPTVAVIHHGSSRKLSELRLVRIVVNLESDLSAETFDHKDEVDKGRYDDLLYRLKHSVLQLAREFNDWISIHLGQTWIEPSGQFPKIVNAISLLDLDASLDFGIMTGSGGVLKIVADEVLLDSESLPAIERSLTEGGGPRADEILLAEAMHILASEQVTGPQRSTLLAAVAVEVNTKFTIQEVADPREQELLELLLQHPRDFSMSIHGLFLKALPVIAKRQLGEEHRKLAVRVQKLFTQRNAIAHRGEAIDKVDAEQHLATAREAFDFLSQLRNQMAAE